MGVDLLDSELHLAPNFQVKEFVCKGSTKGRRCDCGGTFGRRPGDIDPELVAGLQAMRELLKRPITVNSGCRCPSHNLREGGEADSQHLLGKAADLINVPVQDLVWAAKQVPQFRHGGIGQYRTFVHVDTHKAGVPRRWRR